MAESGRNKSTKEDEPKKNKTTIMVLFNTSSNNAQRLSPLKAER